MQRTLCVGPASYGGATTTRRARAALSAAVFPALLIVLLAATTPQPALAEPHGGFTAVSDKCYQCHVTHTAGAGAGLLFPRGVTPKELCYTCHDGTGASTDVRAEFGEAGASRESSHPVAAGVLTCSDCHTPHQGPENGNPRSLAVGPSRESTGNDVCGVCHGTGSTLPAGDLLGTFAGTAHDTSTTPPASGTQITCLACHVPHGSDNAALIPTAVVGSSGVVNPVSVTTTSGPRPLCEACHDVAVGTWGGAAAYAASKHGNVTTSTVASAIASGTAGPAGDCDNCHAPHGGPVPNMLRQAGNTLCYSCHDAAGASYPSGYSYRGSSLMSATPHASIEASAADGSSLTGCTVCHAAMGGARAWDNTLVEGSLKSDEGSLCTGGGVGGTGGCHAVAANSASGVSILAKFSVGSSALARHSVMASDQASAGGRLECSSCHDVHVNTPTAKYSDPDSVDVTLASGLSPYVDSDGRLYAMVGAEHDGSAPIISNLAVDTSAGGGFPVFSWNTDEAATTWLDWGTTAAYELGSFGADLPLTNTHSAAPSGVETTTAYHFRLRSTDALGNQRLSSDYVYEGDVTLLNDPTPAHVDDIPATQTNGEPALLSWAAVTVSDADAPEYLVEITNNNDYNPATYSSGWIAATSWQTPRLSFASWTWRVMARDTIHVNAASSWLYGNSFIVDWWETFGAGASDGAGSPTVLPSVSDAATPSADSGISPVTIGSPSTADTTSGGGTTTVSEPGVGGITYSIDTDRIALETRSRDRTIVSYAPSAGWESSGFPAFMPTQLMPGTPVGGAAIASATNADGSYWVTDLTSSDRAWNWQVVSFDLGADAIAKDSEIALSWVGHGEPTAGYATCIWLWNRITGTWEQVHSADAVSTDRAVTSGVTTSVTDSFCLKCHDGTTPAAAEMRSGVTTISPIWGTVAPSDFHGPRAGTVGPSVSSGSLSNYVRGGQVACAVCHDPHGSQSPYALARFINGVDTAGVAGSNAVGAACYACHTGTTADWHSGCTSCHDSYDADPLANHSNPHVDFSSAANCQDCHNHGSLTKWGTVGIVGAPGCGRGVSHSGGCHTWQTTF